MKLKWSIVVIMSLWMVAMIVQANVLRSSGSAYAQSFLPTPTLSREVPNDVVMNRVTLNANELPSILGFTASNSCSPISSVQGSITTTNPTEAGRLFRDGNPAMCAMSKTYPGLSDSNSRYYAAHWFTNTSGADRCYAVAVNQACIGTNMTFFTTYLNSFNAADPSANYLADIGSSPLPTGGYSFTVPAGANFGIIVNEVTPNQGCANYAFTLNQCSCWGVSATGSITNTDSTQTGRLFRSGVASSCPLPKTFPGTLGSDTIHYDSYSFANMTSTTACYKVDVSTPNCTISPNMIFVAAYLGTFNPANLSANYLADSGSSPALSGSFSFNVPSGQTYKLIASEVTAGAGCANYTLNVSNCAYQVCLPLVQR